MRTNNSGFDGIASGVLGLGRGSLSLTSQLKESCHVPLQFLLLPQLDRRNCRHDAGSDAEHGDPSELHGRHRRLFIDATTPFTYLNDLAYKAVRQAFVSQIKLPLKAAPEGFDLCFELSPNIEKVEVPDVVFHFQGADMELPPKNVFIADPADGLLCLMMGNSTGISVLGNFQLQNMHVLYDLGKQALSFEPAQCSGAIRRMHGLCRTFSCVCVCARVLPS
uniref:Peptidase A1 domain-containing protein n=1 Tax=Ananas comosus var. bracteatus TaxID=296719 RepID=A0A6V7NKV5_ANACO|nr:unnamed protein product [Ananas comosus var. bracteatus]